MNIKNFCYVVTLLIQLSVVGCVSASTDHNTFDKMYNDKLVVADYEGAINVAQKWNQEKKNYWPAVYALANAHLLNLEPQTALAIIAKHVKNMDPHDKDVSDGYFATANLDCACGNFKRAMTVYEMVEQQYPEYSSRIKISKYYCMLQQFSAQENIDKTAYEQFVQEVQNFLQQLKSEVVEPSFTEAVLAYEVTNNKVLAFKLAKLAVDEAERKAEERFGDKRKIPARVKGNACVFYALSGKLSDAHAVVGCSSSCNAAELLEKGNDPLYLARFFAITNDMNSADQCLKALYKKLKTDEQKQRFFRYVITGNKRDSPWKKLSQIPWVIEEYRKYKKDH